MIAVECKLCGPYINRTDTTKDLGIFLHSKIYFH
jgi:hypothetical protein